MPVTPSGSLSVPVNELRKLVSASSSFQTWVNMLADQPRAMNRVYGFGKPRSGVAWPHCLVGWESWQLVAFKGAYATGALYMLFEALIRNWEEPDATYEFTNNVGAIVSDVKNLSEITDGALIVPEITLSDGPTFADQGEAAGEGNVMWARFSVPWSFA